MKGSAIILKKQLRILSLARWDYACCGYFLSQAINDTTEHRSTAVKWEKSTLDFPHDKFKPTMEELRELWLRADVIHVHDAALLPENVPPRPLVVTYHGTMYRNSWQARNAQCELNNWIGTVATVDLTEYGLPWLPDCRPDLSQYVNRPSGSFIVVHAPTRRHIKGTQVVLDAGLDELTLIEKTPWQRALKLKGQAAVTIDQFRLGPGCNAIEGWAMGHAVICNMEKIKLLTGIIGTGLPLPFVPCAEIPEAIRDLVGKLRSDRVFYDETVAAGRRHYEKFHCPKAAAKTALSFYWLAMEAFYSRPIPVGVPTLPLRERKKQRGLKRAPLDIGIEGMEKLRYIGGNVGLETFTGPVTGTHYKFSMVEAVKLVDSRDVPGMMMMGRSGKRKHPEFERA